MLGIQLIILGVVLILFPIIIGMLFGESNDKANSVAFFWVKGQIMLWAGFLLICVPFILLQSSFTLVCNIFHVYTGLLIFASVLWNIAYYVKAKKFYFFDKQKKEKNKSKGTYLLWAIFGTLLLLQLILTVFMAYEEGDDAFYIATSTITNDADSMYIKLPYTGGSTGLDARHGLAPFPIWIAYLARVSGMAPVTIAQILLSLTVISMAYAIYYLIAEHICSENRNNIPFFLIMVELLVLFGGYSLYTVENFLLVRASQGKAVIANIILPFILYLVMLLLDRMQKSKRIPWNFWMLLTMTNMAGCLCSTLGTILICMLVGVAGLCVAVCYRKWKILIPMALSCVVPVGMALLYFVIL